jgi:hypothetical protein
MVNYYGQTRLLLLAQHGDDVDAERIMRPEKTRYRKEQ